MAIPPFYKTLCRWGLVFGQLGLAILFGIAAYIKFKDPFSFGQQIVAYALPLPYQAIDILVWVVPGVEFCIALLLLSGVYTRIAASLSAILLTGFTLLVLTAMSRGLAIDCGCFGIPQPVGWGKVSENVCLIILAVTLIKWPGYTSTKIKPGTGRF